MFGPLPPGTTATQPRCVSTWASALITAPDQDNVFAVFEVGQGGWLGKNLGTDGVCSGAGVPQNLYTALGCGPWES
jgi:hypothetical protein